MKYILLALIVAGCAAGTVAQPTVVPSEQPKEEYTLSCDGPDGKPLQCEYRNDCCTGFDCIPDPESNHKICVEDSK